MKKISLLLSFVCILGMTSKAQYSDSAVQTNSTALFTEGILPVNLIAYNITRFGSSNMLYWSTAFELNNSYFELQKSIDGKQFNMVTFLEGAGTTNEVSNYEYLDLESRTVYYRLKQVDYDGNYEYSDIIKVILDEDPDLILTTIFTTQGQVVYIDDEPVDLSKIGKFGKVMVIKQYNKKPTTKEYKVLD